MRETVNARDCECVTDDVNSHKNHVELVVITAFCA